MPTAKRLIPALAVLLCALAANGRAQTSSVEVAVEETRAIFSAQGEARMMQVEVYSPGGELLFVSGFVEGRAADWSLRDLAGRPVADGVYLAAITVVDAEGKLTKRVEQVVVGGHAQSPAVAGTAYAPDPTPQAPATITGEGTAGKIAKFTGTHLIGNSVITESAGKINVGANLAPTATLQVNGAQPPAVANGTNADNLLQTTGGKGGNTTASSTVGGAGANIVLMAGSGGNAVSGATNGSGGSVTIQPGSPGTGGSGGSTGKVLIAPTVGKVGIGTSTPSSKLSVKDSALTNVVSAENTSTVVGSVGILGKGITGLAGLASGCCGTGVYGEGNYGVHGKTTGAASISAGVFGEASSDYGVMGKSLGSAGVYGESQATNAGGVYGVNNANSTTAKGVYGFSSRGYGVFGRSVNGYAGYFEGVVGVKSTVEIGGTAFFGASTRQMILLYNNTYAIGVQPSTHYFRTNNGFAWYKGGTHVNTAFSPGTGGVRLMKLDSAGTLTVTSLTQTSDRNVKSGFAAVNPRAILDKLNSLPIQTWSYKADEDAVRHIGPVAQDFKAAFDLGADDKHISAVDADGVTMAAVQGLYRMMLEKEKQNAEKDRKIDELTRRLAQIESQMAEVRRDVRRRRAPRRSGR